MIIEQAQLTVAADTLSKIYGEVDPALTYTITEGNLYGEDSLSGELVRSPGEDVATYAISVGVLTAGDNYSITFVEGLFTIDQALLTVTPDSLSKTMVKLTLN
ncbi:MAG: MBG domain-containing protein [Bacteroidales bacterium]